MPVVQFYRYFLGFRPDPALRCRIVSGAKALGVPVAAGDAERLHLTLCVIDEATERNHFLAARVDGLVGGVGFASCRIRLGRLYSGHSGSVLRAIGAQDEIRCFYARLAGLIAQRGLVPLHRKSGLNAHITLGHAPSPRLKAVVPLEWIPQELLLVESWVGVGRHDIIGRWPLLAPLQAEFDFKARSGCTPVRAVAGKTA